jgi:hypothetical protein
MVLTITVGNVSASEISPEREGLVVYDRGPAVYYSAQYDNGGWDRIIAARMAWGEGDPDTFAYSSDGYYCVHPDFDFGNVVTLQNARTGQTIRCTVADTVAPQDVSWWRQHATIELSYRAWRGLALDRENDVIMWVAPNGTEGV